MLTLIDKWRIVELFSNKKGRGFTVHAHNAREHAIVRAGLLPLRFAIFL